MSSSVNPPCGIGAMPAAAGHPQIRDSSAEEAQRRSPGVRSWPVCRKKNGNTSSMDIGGSDFATGTGKRFQSATSSSAKRLWSSRAKSDTADLAIDGADGQRRFLQRQALDQIDAPGWLG